MVAAPESPDVSGHWEVVLPRCRKRRKVFPRAPQPEHPQQPWTPTDCLIDPVRESKLMHKMQKCMKKLKASAFYISFLDQIRAPEVFHHFSKVLGPNQKMNLVIYGIGSIEFFEPPCLQLSLAILMKTEFNWIGDIEVFDPILSVTETRVMESLGCSVLSINEQGEREALKPTLFFMPHCEAVLYNNLLRTNWKASLLSNVALFGNSFEAYESHASILKDYALDDSKRYIIASRRFANEFKVYLSTDDYFTAFNESSWHFFSPNPDQGLPLV